MIGNSVYVQRMRDRRRANGLCIDCGKSDERTLGGKSRCAACLKKSNEFNRIRRKRIREEQSRRKKEKLKGL